jgi:hypothetical protein
MAWALMPEATKQRLRSKLPDGDRDNVPTGFDCHSRNPKKTDDFLPLHKEFADKVTKVTPGKLLGRGCVGEVHTVKGNDEFIVKVPRINGRAYSARKLSVESIQEAEEELRKEAEMYKQHDLNKLPLFIPVKVIQVDYPKHKGQISILKPKVQPITEYYPDLHFKIKPTDKQLQQLYESLMTLSGRGVCFVDGLQLGVDPAGRIEIYDAGFIEFEKPGSERAYRVNNYQWIEILEVLGKQDKFPPLDKPIKRPAIGARRKINDIRQLLKSAKRKPISARRK